jgi:hypothetical protein
VVNLLDMNALTLIALAMGLGTSVTIGMTTIGTTTTMPTRAGTG